MIDAAEPLEPAKRPDFFYKYRPVRDDAERQKLFQIIEACKIYYAPPASFNDPFDCKVPSVGSLDPWFFRYLIAAQNAKSADDRVEVWHKFIAPGSRTQAERDALRSDLSAAEEIELKAFVERIQQEVNQTGVLCFSARCDSTLMWSHYAGSHRGVCLKFSLEKWPIMNHGLYPVTYPVERLALRLDRQNFDKGQLYKAVVLTKDQSWCYEQEWRILCKRPKEVSFPSDALVGIIFGCIMSDADKASVRQAVAGRDHIVFYQAKMKEGKFGLDILPC